ncbi:MAG: hypothetical protein V1850_06380 [Candidatus Bathyarchaeota archaeon]
MQIDPNTYPFLSEIVIHVYQNQLEISEIVNGAHDSNWSKEFELFYNRQPKSSPYVKRLFLKKIGTSRRTGKVGYVDIRPITDGSEVSEAYLNPPDNISTSNSVYPKCVDSYNEFGESIRCTPYIMPDTIFGMCIHASVWICLKILERKKMIAQSLTIPEIQELVAGNPYTDKQGLLFVQTARLLRMCRTQAFYIISSEAGLNDEQMLTELYAYVESGLPVILGVDTAMLPWWIPGNHGYHSIVAIGHTMSNNEIDGFIFHDESRLPYQVLKKTDLINAWNIPYEGENQNYERELLVAVPPEVVLPFFLVFQEFRQFISSLRNRNVFSETLNDLSIQPILMVADDLVHFAFESDNVSFFDALSDAGTFGVEKGYFWVIFLFESGSNRTEKKNAKAFFIRDATQKNDFRLICLQREKDIVYQINGKFYRRRGRSRRRTQIE